MQKTTATTMKALVVDGYGPPQNGQIRDVDVPKIKDGFLLVRLRAAAVNPFDDKIITGMVKDWVHTSFPYVPGMDGAGEVAEVGSGVDGWNKGDALVAMFNGGAFAQYALVSAGEKRLARKPEALDFEHAAAVPEVGLTAKTMLRAAGTLSNKTVLVIGATGGVGSILTQLAKADVARVIATGKGADVEYLRSLGADDVIDYGGGDTIEQARQRYPNGVDVLFDVINSGEGLLRSADALRDGGTLVSSLGGPDASAFPRSIDVHSIQMSAGEGDLEDLLQRVASGKLRVEIGKIYDLSQTAQALTDLIDPSKHTRGKLVVRIS